MGSCGTPAGLRRLNAAERIATASCDAGEGEVDPDPPGAPPAPDDRGG